MLTSKSMRSLGLAVATAAIGLATSTCFPKLSGAPCDTDNNCPKGQVCTAAGICGDGTSLGQDAGTEDGGAPTADGGALTACDGGTYDLQTDPSHCGACDTVCNNPNPLPNTAPVCAAAKCGVGCKAGWGDCNPGAGAGCQFDVTGDIANCGACGHVCGGRNTVGGAKCAAGACVFNCVSGTTHCSADDATGCDTTVGTDPLNCGFCGYSCGSATCAGGVCRFTAGHELITNSPSVTSLVMDGTYLYWANDEGFAPPTSHVIRRAKKDGTELRDLQDSTFGPTHGWGTSLTLDQNYVYYFQDTYGKLLYRLVKSGVQQATLLATVGGVVATAVLSDGDDSHAATYIYFTQVTNGAGFWRVPVAPPNTPVQLFSASEARGLVRTGNTVVFFALGDNTIRYFDGTQATPAISILATMSKAPGGIAADATNVYVLLGDGTLYRIPWATGNAEVMATSGVGVGVLLVDGANLYLAGGDLYRIPVTASNKPLAQFRIVDRAALPTSSPITGVQVDADSVYFSTYPDVFKTRK